MGRSSRMATSGAASCASPQPKRIFEMRPIKWLLEKGRSSSPPAEAAFRPSMKPGRQLRRHRGGHRQGLCSELLARELDADCLHHGDRRRCGLHRLGQADGKGIRRAHREPSRRAYSSRPARWAQRSMLRATSPRHRQARGDRCAEGPGRHAARRGGDHDHWRATANRMGCLKGTTCKQGRRRGRGDMIQLKLSKWSAFVLRGGDCACPGTCGRSTLPHFFRSPARSVLLRSAAAPTVWLCAHWRRQRDKKGAARHQHECRRSVSEWADPIAEARRVAAVHRAGGRSSQLLRYWAPGREHRRCRRGPPGRCAQHTSRSRRHGIHHLGGSDRIGRRLRIGIDWENYNLLTSSHCSLSRTRRAWA